MTRRVNRSTFVFDDQEGVNTHINTFSRVLAERSSQRVNFEEEIKALALLSSLSASWEVFYTTVTNSSPKLTLDETIGIVLSEDIRRRSMGLTINNSTEAYYSIKPIYRTGRSPCRLRRRRDHPWSKTRNGRPNAFCTHCRKADHNVADCWSIKKKENGQ